MGIKNLMQLLVDKACDSIQDISIESLSGRILACDASIVSFFRYIINFQALYQFLVSTTYNVKGVGVK